MSDIEYLREKVIKSSVRFKAIAEIEDTELQDQQFREIFVSHLNQYRANTGAADLLRATKSPVFYPFEGNQAENSRREAAAFDDILNKDTIRYLLETSDLSDISDRQILRFALKRFIGLEFWPLEIEISNDRASKKGFWKREIKPLPKGGKMITFLDEFQGENPWQRYNRFKSDFLSGRIDTRNLDLSTEIFNSVEKAASKQEAKKIFKVINLIDELGFSSVDEWLTFMIGIEPEQLRNQMEEVLMPFRQYFKVEGRKNYITRQLATLEWTWEISEDVVESTLKSLEELGVDLESWSATTETITDIAPEIGTAVYYFIQSEPQFIDKYPQLGNSLIWQKIFKGKTSFLLMKPEANHPEGFRYSFHEAGHALESFYRIIKGSKPTDVGFAQNGRPMTLNEIFSLFHESRMPQTDFFINRERFLTARFAGLTLHELNIWRNADKYMKKEIGFGKFIEEIEKSYQETFGEGVNCDVPSGRSLTDFFSPVDPLFSSGYVYGMVGAGVIDGYIKAEEKRGNTFFDSLSEIADVALNSENIEEVLYKIGYSWEEALSQTHKFFLE